MPQNIRSYGATRSSIDHHTGWSSHHQPRSASWQNGIIGAGCQATVTCSADVPRPCPSPTTSPQHLVNGMALPVEGVKSARTARSAAADGGTLLDPVTKNCKANQSFPRWWLKKNRTARKRRQNSEVDTR